MTSLLLVTLQDFLCHSSPHAVIFVQTWLVVTFLTHNAIMVLVGTNGILGGRSGLLLEEEAWHINACLLRGAESKLVFNLPTGRGRKQQLLFTSKGWGSSSRIVIIKVLEGKQSRSGVLSPPHYLATPPPHLLLPYELEFSVFMKKTVWNQHWNTASRLIAEQKLLYDSQCPCVEPVRVFFKLCFYVLRSYMR